MKKTSKSCTLVLLLALFLPLLPLKAQEKVHKITRDRRANDFYVTQKGLWAKETEKASDNAEAWYNLYKAYRYADFPRVFTDTVYRKEIDQLVKTMGKEVPDSYEYMHVKAWHGGNNTHDLPLLELAHRKSPERPEVLEDLVTHHTLKGNWDKVSTYHKAWYKSAEMPPSLLLAGFNIFQSLEANSILFTFGDNDTFPLWMLQEARGICTNVPVLNASLLQRMEYAKKVLARYKINYEQKELDALHQERPARAEKIAVFVRHIQEMNPDRPVFLSPFAEGDVYAALENELYLVGMAHKYSSKSLDNLALLKRNWYHRMNLDYYNFNVYQDLHPYEASIKKQLHSGYFPAAFTLYKHHRLSGENGKAEILANFIRNLSKGTSKENEVEQYLESLRKETNEDRG